MGTSERRGGFEDLRVYRLSEELADALWDMVKEWSPLPRDSIGKQLARAGDSIGANVVEGYGRGSFQDNRRFVKIARGSLYETRHWLRRAYKRKLLTESQIFALQPLIEELGPRLNAYLKSIGSRRSDQ